jgi:murein DD-endopeptidase MepM/ murein hydrolase activator NlpD
MTLVNLSGQSGTLSRIRHTFRTREVFFHDGQSMKRFALTTRMQLCAVGAMAVAVATTVAGLAGVAVSAPGISASISTYASRNGEIKGMETRVAQLQAEVSAIRIDARTHAKRLEARHAFLTNLLKGEEDAVSLSAFAPAFTADRPGKTSDVHVWFSAVEAGQREIAVAAGRIAEARYNKTLAAVSNLGIDPRRIQLGMGGPYEPVVPSSPAEAQSASMPAPTVRADPQFKALFNSWKRLDQLQQGMVSIPSVKPVMDVTINSGFGVRNDPFRGGRAMHAGVDIPGPYGTPIHATADGIVGRSGWVSGYGKLIELEHGRGIQTRYGHLSSWAVAPGMRIKRGQLIGMMGSTGRSTGNHLHYEVRIDGRAVNPLPFLRSNDYLIAMQAKTQAAQTAVGGPNKGE